MNEEIGESRTMCIETTISSAWKSLGASDYKLDGLVLTCSLRFKIPFYRKIDQGMYHIAKSTRNPEFTHVLRTPQFLDRCYSMVIHTCWHLVDFISPVDL